MPDPAPNHAAADCNLLFGVLALQMDFITRDALVAAMQVWVFDKANPLGQILLAQGRLTAQRLRVLDALVLEHLDIHHGDPQKSLAAASPPVSVRQELRNIADGDIQGSLDSLAVFGSTDPNATGPYVPRPEHGCPGSRYRVLRPYARGGLGEVFVAQDTELGREVALKEIRADQAHDAHSRARFLQEATITGRLEHPGIVPVYGLGQYADGRPYYAMRFIQGETLKNAIMRFHTLDRPSEDSSKGRLALRHLLSQFIALCNAVAYAHSRGVLHRDVKPSNAILGKYGEALVLDWGLAKAVGRPEAERDTSELPLPLTSDDDLATQPGTTLGTPAYMSPEQAQGQWDRVGPASDVYGLGATLYTLLTGRAPIQGNDKGDLLRKAGRGEWLPARQVKRDVPAALDAVCCKAMAREPKDRYPEALALAADVEHWLADEPVGAYREPLPVKLGRWVRRHQARVAATAAALLVALLVGGGAWLWAAERRAETDRAVALALGKAEQLRNQASKMPVEELGDAVAALAVWKQGLTADEQADEISAAGLAGEETVRRAERLLAEVRAGVKMADQAVVGARKYAEMLAALDKARMARSRWTGKSFDFAASTAAYAAAFSTYGLDVLAQEPAAAVRLLRQLPGPKRSPLVLALDDWALCERIKEVEQRLHRIADRVDDDVWRRRFRNTGDLRGLKRLAVEARRQSLPVVSLEVLAHALWRRGARAEATAILLDAQGRYPGDFWINMNLATSLWRTGIESKGSVDLAIGYYRAAVALRPDNPAAHYNLGLTLKAKGDLKGAITAYRRAIALDSKDPTTHYNLGLALDAIRDFKGAIAAYGQAIAVDPRYAPAHNNLGAALDQQGDLKGAIVAYRHAIALDGKDPVYRNNLGTVLAKQWDVKGAMAAYRQAIVLDPKYAEAYYNLGNAFAAQGDVAGAIEAYQWAIHLQPLLFDAHFTLGFALRREGRFEESLASLRRGHRLGIQQPYWNSPSAEWVTKGERLVELNKQCPTFLGREGRPVTAKEGLELAELCAFKKHFAASCSFYRRAFAMDPKGAAGKRLSAACCAALAGCGRGRDAAGLKPEQKTKLRRQALAWLRADLPIWAKTLQEGKSQPRETSQPSLRDWPHDPDLACVREKTALAKLPEAERREWVKFWDKVAALVAKASEKK
jgi:tetratricopeptide (TPR) repeat protein/tRNA A-37 threonylcarbamoyl transferase component Bud32